MQPDILNDLTPESDLFEADQPPALSRCLDHGVAGRADCTERIKRAREVAAARLKPAESGSMVVTSPPSGKEQPSVILLAQEFAELQDQLNRERQLLVAAESRVEFLRDSIVASQVAVETARKALTDHLATIG